MTNKSICYAIFSIALFGCASSSTNGDVVTRQINYFDCLQKKDEIADGYRPLARVVEVQTGSKEFRTTRICTNDGSVLITCSRPDNKMIITRSNHKC